MQPVSSSSSDEDSEVDKIVDSKTTERLPNPLAGTTCAASLPSPLSSSSCNESVRSSVFINPFKKAEQAKLSVLEQHVKLTDSERVERENRRNICNNFKKGRCRFGNKCKYRHVIDAVNTPKPQADTDSKTPEAQHGYYGQHSYHGNIAEDEVDDDSYFGQMKRKHRSGVRDNLVPPKKALRSLEDQRAKERPWTMNR